jgi:uncharacterized membrane protein
MGEWTFRVPAAIEHVYEFFVEPAQLCELLDGVESIVPVGEGRVRWVLKEKVAKGIRFKGDYTVLYQGNNVDHVHWHSLEGNMGNEGDVWLTATAEGDTEIRYREMVESDLPITPILAKLIKPMVERELRAELEAFLTRVKASFEAS